MIWISSGVGETVGASERGSPPLVATGWFERRVGGGQGAQGAGKAGQAQHQASDYQLS
ncbi:MAG: hypothetical protein P8Y03_02765 [Anaerolineales bacterium]